jgi:hypothetical protein
MNRLVAVFVVTAAVAVAAGSAHAQVQPLPSSTAALQLGLDHARGLALQGAFALGKANPTDVVQNGLLVTARADGASQVVGVGLGAQLHQRFSDVVFLREVVVAEPFVSALDGPVVGARGDVLLQLGLDLGGVHLLLGPRATAVAVLDRDVGGRVVLDGVVGVRVPITDHVAVVGSASAGGEQAHRGGALQPGGAVSGSLWVGVQLGL